MQTVGNFVIFPLGLQNDSILLNRQYLESIRSYLSIILIVAKKIEAFLLTVLWLIVLILSLELLMANKM